MIGHFDRKVGDRKIGAQRGQAVKLAALVALALSACTAPAEQETNQQADGGQPVKGKAAPQPGNSGAALAGKSDAIRGEVTGLTGDISDLTVRVTEFATVVDLASDVLFEFDKFTLTPSADEPMNKLLTYVQAGGTGKIVVSGYTDAKGEDAYNLTLSQKRAQAVADWLKAHGVEASRFDVVGRGEADPVAPNAKADGSDEPEGRAKNRRVSVAIPKKGG